MNTRFPETFIPAGTSLEELEAMLPLPHAIEIALTVDELEGKDYLQPVDKWDIG